ncbi:hypothetical protein FACS1894141_1120 [Spirochaetia bacterium]|nr:hypothetical protein FACS1894141_1120 [Spirochaetia bacterium]
MGSVRSTTGDMGTLEERYEYDAFGKPYKGDFNTGMSLGYTGKPYDQSTGLYDYGYRDYKPELARFTTVDPIRDGANWFVYVNNDAINWIDPLGLSTNDIKDTYFRRLPVGNAEISSEYGKRDDVDIFKVGPFHSGIDYKVPNSTPVVAPASGVVVEVVNNYYYGNVVAIEHDFGVTSYSVHLSTTDVKQGDRVTAGTQIGTSGNTGDYADEKFHLHFSVFPTEKAPVLGTEGRWTTSDSIDPAPLFIRPGRRIPNASPY